MIFFVFLPEYEKNGSFVPLQEVDASSEVIREITMLNTLKHYKVRCGISLFSFLIIIVFSRTTLTSATVVFDVV